MKKFLVFLFFVVLGFTHISAQSLSNWGSWAEIDDYASYRVRCVRLNSSNKLYSWEIEVKNNSNKDLGISVAISSMTGTQSSWSRNTISSGDSYVFPLMFCDAGPNERVRIYTKNLTYK